MLPPRLCEVVRHVLRGRPMADIGTDHGQLPATLVCDGVVPHAIGIDNKAAPLQRARNTKRRMHADALELRLGHGLAPLEAGEVDTVVIAGMGGARLVGLLDAWPGLPTLPRLVVQPNTSWADVRRWVAARRIALLDETMVMDHGRAYLTLVLEPATRQTAAWADDGDALAMGPELIVRRPEAWRQWIDAEIQRLGTARVRAVAAGATTLPQLDAELRRLARFRG